MSNRSTDYLKRPLARTALLRRLGLVGAGALSVWPASAAAQSTRAFCAGCAHQGRDRGTGSGPGAARPR